LSEARNEEGKDCGYAVRWFHRGEGESERRVLGGCSKAVTLDLNRQ
jgi:hypothetical protein